MSTNGTHRSWRLIAQELAQETDPLRITALADELQAALEAQEAGELPPPTTPEQSRKGDSKDYPTAS